MCTSARIPFAIFLRNSLAQFFSQSVHTFFPSQTQVGSSEDAASGMLFRDAFLVVFFRSAILIDQFFGVLRDIISNNVNFFTAQSRQQFRNLLPAMAAMDP